jgi:hypothetical protein
MGEKVFILKGRAADLQDLRWCRAVVGSSAVILSRQAGSREATEQRRTAKDLKMRRLRRSHGVSAQVTYLEILRRATPAQDDKSLAVSPEMLTPRCARRSMEDRET